jgi:hypothetical protein
MINSTAFYLLILYFLLPQAQSHDVFPTHTVYFQENSPQSVLPNPPTKSTLKKQMVSPFYTTSTENTLPVHPHHNPTSTCFPLILSYLA